MNPETTQQASNKMVETATGFFGVSGVLLAVAGCLGILFLVTAVAPGISQRCSRTLQQKFLLSFGLGLPILFVFYLALAALHRSGAGAGVVAALGGCLVLLGWASASEDIGRRLFWNAGASGNRATHLAAGWLVFATASFFPVLGWFLVFPFVTVAGLGSLPLSLLLGSGKPEPRPLHLEPTDRA